MNLLRSEEFNSQTDCGSNCLQHKTNEWLHICNEENEFDYTISDKLEKPEHINFI